jgi:hypothetical protein
VDAQVVTAQLGGFTDTIVRQWQGGDLTWDTGVSSVGVNWNVFSPEIFAEPGQKSHYARALFRSVMPSGIVTVNAIVHIDGRTVRNMTATQYSLGTDIPSGVPMFAHEVPIELTGFSANVQLSGTGKIGLDAIDWETKPKALGSPPSTMVG